MCSQPLSTAREMPPAPFQRSIGLAELSRWSPWPQRLLSGRKPARRTPAEIEREYNREKYPACLAYLAEHPDATPADLRLFEMGGNPERELVVSLESDLFLTTVGEALRYQNERFLSLIFPWAESVDAVCELGCGYGHFLWLLRQHFPQKRYWGGEVSSNAVVLAEKLFTGTGITAGHFDLTDPHCPIPFSREERVLVFTVFAMDALPSAAETVRRMVENKGEEWTVCHFEPVLDWCATDLLGLLRRAYTEQNDYNRDLLSVLESHPRVNILDTAKEFLGMNPLHPTSFLCWK